jgi:hypothetical protein
VYASQAAIALAGAQHAGHLSDAVATRDLIERAKGVLMQRHHIGEDEAFRLLVRSSNDLRVKLTDLAARIDHEAAVDATHPREPANGFRSASDRRPFPASIRMANRSHSRVSSLRRGGAVDPAGSAQSLGARRASPVHPLTGQALAT